MIVFRIRIIEYPGNICQWNITNRAYLHLSMWILTMLIVRSLTEPKELSVGSYLVEPTIPITGEIDVLSGHNA